MKSNNVIITSTAVIIPFLFGCGEAGAPVENHSTHSQTPANVNLQEIYRTLRATASQITPEIVGLSNDAPDSTVLAVIYEWWPDESNLATIFFCADGTSSIYFSNGSGIIGSGEYQRVNDAARFCITRFAQYQEKFVPLNTEDIPFPELHHTQITLVTKGGVKSVSVNTHGIMNPDHDLHELFQAKELMTTLIREESERVKKEREADVEP